MIQELPAVLIGLTFVAALSLSVDVLWDAHRIRQAMRRLNRAGAG